MDAYEIDQTQEKYDRICEAAVKAIRDDRNLVTSEYWVAHLITADSVTRFAVNGNRDTLFINFRVYTQMTGGSYEYPEAEIPLDTLNRYL